MLFLHLLYWKGKTMPYYARKFSLDKIYIIMYIFCGGDYYDHNSPPDRIAAKIAQNYG